MVGPMPYTVHQALNDPGTRWGRQVSLKSANLKELSDPVLEIITRYVAEKTSPLTMVPINSWGGAINRVPDDATAFGHRDTKFTIYIFTMWTDPSDSDRTSRGPPLPPGAAAPHERHLRQRDGPRRTNP